MKRILSIALLLGIGAVAFGQEIPFDVHNRGLNFPPDYTFKGSGLTGWHPMGAASWQARDGEISTNANGGSSLLVLNKSYQDVDIELLIKAAPGAEAGVLLRMGKTADGYKGLLLAIKNGEAVNYRVTLDARGKELSREKLSRAGSTMRIAPKPAEGAAANGRNSGGVAGGFRQGASNLNLPITRPETAIQVNEWNQA
jgi:hypothetical protein